MSVYFATNDFCDELPAAGFYRAMVTDARFCISGNDNQMLQVTHLLSNVPPLHEIVSDYFVLEGSRRGVCLARRRLVQLYRACEFVPKEGDEISPAALIDAALEVEVNHDQWRGQSRLRVTGYRAIEPDSAADSATPF